MFSPGPVPRRYVMGDKPRCGSTFANERLQMLHRIGHMLLGLVVGIGYHPGHPAGFLMAPARVARAGTVRLAA